MARRLEKINVEYSEVRALTVASYILDHFGYEKEADDLRDIVADLGGDPGDLGEETIPDTSIAAGHDIRKSGWPEY